MLACLSTRHALAIAAFIGLAALDPAQPVSAQAPAPQTAAPSPGAILLAKQIMDLKHANDIFAPLVRGVIIKARDTFMQTNFMWAKDLNEIANNLQAKFAPRASELVDASARIYASHFTEQELRDLLAFYKSPLGQKVIVEDPKSLDESMSNADKWAEDLSLEVINNMRAEMKKRGHDI